MDNGWARKVVVGVFWTTVGDDTLADRRRRRPTQSQSLICVRATFGRGAQGRSPRLAKTLASGQIYAEVRPKAWGVLPGGQSGNPGSKTYTTSLNSWASGDYHHLNFLKNLEAVEENWKMQTFKPLKE